MTLEKEFKEYTKAVMSKSLDVGLYDSLGLDAQAREEADNLLEAKGFNGEVFTNTYKMYFDNEDLEKVMQMTLDLDNFFSECLSKVGVTRDEFEDKTSEVINRFFEDHSAELLEITQKSYDRQ